MGQDSLKTLSISVSANASGKKLSQSFLRNHAVRQRRASMRIKHAIFAGSIAALASMTAPALAKHSDAPKADEPSAASPCSARQQAADGTWTQVGCQELGSPEQTPRKSATQSPDEKAR
jgi:hypothetical protein